MLYEIHRYFRRGVVWWLILVAMLLISLPAALMGASKAEVQRWWRDSFRKRGLL